VIIEEERKRGRKSSHSTPQTCTHTIRRVNWRTPQLGRRKRWTKRENRIVSERLISIETIHSLFFNKIGEKNYLRTTAALLRVGASGVGVVGAIGAVGGGSAEQFTDSSHV
jgi:hypothetical protein